MATRAPKASASRAARGTTGTQSPRVARRRARTEQAIVVAAEEVFRDEGYEAARIERIAEIADVSVGSIYSHFDGKRGLYEAVALRAVELFGRYLEAGYQPGLTPLERVLASGNSYMRFNLEHPALFRFIAFNGIEAGTPAPSSELSRRASEAIEEIIGSFESQVAAAIADGDAVDHDPRLVSHFLFGAWNGVVALSLREDASALTEDEVAAALAVGRRMVIEGLASGQARGEDGRLRDDITLLEIESPAD